MMNNDQSSSENLPTEKSILDLLHPDTVAKINAGGYKDLVTKVLIDITPHVISGINNASDPGTKNNTLENEKIIDPQFKKVVANIDDPKAKKDIEDSTSKVINKVAKIFNKTSGTKNDSNADEIVNDKYSSNNVLNSQTKQLVKDHDQGSDIANILHSTTGILANHLESQANDAIRSKVPGAAGEMLSNATDAVIVTTGNQINQLIDEVKNVKGNKGSDKVKKILAAVAEHVLIVVETGVAAIVVDGSEIVGNLAKVGIEQTMHSPVIGKMVHDVITKIGKGSGEFLRKDIEKRELKFSGNKITQTTEHVTKFSIADNQDMSPLSKSVIWDNSNGTAHDVEVAGDTTHL